MISMIHNSSTDPVLIKKISLKIWSLRDEIEARLNEKIAAGAPTEHSDLMEMREDYTPKNLKKNNVLSLKPNSELNTDEDEMARAMAEAEAEEAAAKETPPEETPAEGVEAAAETATTEEAPTESANKNNVVNIDQNIISINLEAPQIPEDKIAKAKTVLSEISMDKMFFFCNKSFTEGQSIVIQFCIPNSFIVNATILYCRPFNLKSRIISQNNYTHRSLIRFNFLKEGERALLRQFLQSVEPDVTKVKKKAGPAKSEEEGSDFGDLDDLGL